MKKGKSNEPFELKKLRAEVCLRQHKKLVWLLIVVALLVLAFLNYSTIVATVNRVKNLDPTKIGVLGTLFGALIGGIMSLFGSVWVNSKRQKAKKYIMRKNLIYSPLYDELVKKKEEAFSEQRYPTDVKFVKDEQRLIGLIEFSAWERIKSDTRYLEAPNELIQQMKLFQETVEQYLSALEDTALEVETIIKEVFEENGKPVQTFDRLAKRVASIIMSENNENLYYEICHGKEDTETSKKIDAEIRKKVKENPKAKKLEEAYNSWESVHEQTIEFLGLMIQQVLTKYEE